MQRHIIDRPKPGQASGRAKAFLKLARAPRPAPYRPDRRLGGTGRLAQYLRIARGREA